MAQLGPAHRDRIVTHLLELPLEDRRLRFGHVPGDASIAAYVRGIRFFRDAAFGAFDDTGRLLGFGHLAFSASDAEFAVSVNATARSHGIGLALVGRASVHASNRGHRTLAMLYLPENEALASLARRAGMQIVCDPSECRAYLSLASPTPQSVLSEAWREAIAAVDLGFRLTARPRGRYICLNRCV